VRIHALKRVSVNVISRTEHVKRVIIYHGVPTVKTNAGRIVRNTATKKAVPVISVRQGIMVLSVIWTVYITPVSNVIVNMASVLAVRLDSGEETVNNNVKDVHAVTL